MIERRRGRKCLVFQGLLFFLMSGFLRAQTPGTGAITGRIIDPSGALVTDAQVSVVSEETNSVRIATTTPEGLFRVSLLPPGNYSIKVEVKGFEREVVSSIRVVATETAVVDVKLRLGATTTAIEVTGAAELAQTDSAALGRVTDDKTLVALPLANRNFTEILALSPGVLMQVPDAGQLGRNTQNISVNGQKSTSNNFQFNGVDANNISVNSASGYDPEVGIAVPAPDTIAEFKVQTGMYDAGYGRDAGANVDIISKGGTNKFHGNLWEFFRNDALNANNYFLNQNHQPRPVLKQNQCGGSLGGPLQRDKTFFFGSYQATIQRNGEASGSLVTTSLPPLTDNRSRAALGALFAGQSGALGGVAVAPDGSNINPVALALLQFKLPDGSYAIPSPQTILPSGIGESTFSSPAQYREDQFSTNIDHFFSQQDQLSGRFFYSRGAVNEPFTPFAATVPGFPTNTIDGNDMFVLAHTHVFSPNLINVARFGFMRFNGDQSYNSAITAADVGMATPAGLPAIPGININGLFNIGPAGQPFYLQKTNTFIWQDTLSLTRGRHNLRLGGEAHWNQVYVNAPFTEVGFILFLSFPDFLLGENGTENGSGESNIFNSAGASGNFARDQRYRDFAGFVQDDIKVTSLLMVNAGLRYEYFGPPTEINGRLSNFDPSLASAQVPASSSFSGILLPANYNGPLPSGVTKTPNSGLWNADYLDFAPRLGFALRLHDAPTIVLRGGYGVYYQALSGQLVEQNIGEPPFSFRQSFQGVANAAATFQQPFNPPLPPDSAFPIFIPRIPTSAVSIAAIGQNLKSPYTQQYNLDVQYEFARDFLWELGYVGSRSARLTGCVQFNQALIATPQNPVNGLTTTTTLNLQQRVPFAGVAGGSYICQTAFNANYNGFQTTVIKKLSHGLDFQGSYTFSKSLGFTGGTGGLPQLDLAFLGNDQTNPGQSYGLTDLDRTHRFVLNFVYEPPKLAMGPHLLQYLFSNWQFSGVSVLQSGLPITVTDSSAASVYGNLSFSNFAQCTGANPASSGPLSGRLSNYFNPAAFAPPPAIGNGTGFGNCGVGILRGPGQRNLDLGIQRTFAIAENHALQFRSEFFNFTNTPQFGQPVSDRAAGLAFGLISSTVSNPRIIQFALKYNF